MSTTAGDDHCYSCHRPIQRIKLPMCEGCQKIIGPETSPQPDNPNAALCQFCWDEQRQLTIHTRKIHQTLERIIEPTHTLKDLYQNPPDTHTATDPDKVKLAGGEVSMDDLVAFGKIVKQANKPL